MSGLCSLSALWPTPEPVTVGGEPFRATCFRLRDLARLEAIAAALAGDPLAGRRIGLLGSRAAAAGDYLGESMECRAYAGALRGAILAATPWPTLGSPAADRLLATSAGLVLWLDALLARHNPGFDAAAAARLLPAVAAEEWAKLHGVAYADHPLDWLDRLADPCPMRKGPAQSWGERIVRFIEAFPAYTIEAAGDLYLSQWHALISGGGREPGTVSARTPAERAWKKARDARRRRLMAGG